MIDTDKYEGHTPAPWLWVDSSKLEGENTVCELSQGIGEANKQLIADAPLLLEEVKRLRHELEIKKEALAKSQSSYKELRKHLKEMIE